MDTIYVIYTNMHTNKSSVFAIEHPTLNAPYSNLKEIPDHTIITGSAPYIPYFSVIKVNSVFFFHNETESCFIMYDEAHFAINGQMDIIDNLPIDNEYKLILKIKYGDNTHGKITYNI